MNGTSFNSLIEQLKDRGIGFDAGLSDSEVDAIEARYGFTFPQDLKLFLQTALPISEPYRRGAMWIHSFPNWRTEPEEHLLEWLDLPYDGICFDVCQNSFWMASWGSRPDSDEDACKVVRRELNRAPKLIPVYGHRFMPDRPSTAGNPVYSVVQTDIICYGGNLANYLQNEFINGPNFDNPTDVRDIDFWSYFIHFL